MLTTNRLSKIHKLSRALKNENHFSHNFNKPCETSFIFHFINPCVLAPNWLAWGESLCKKRSGHSAMVKRQHLAQESKSQSKQKIPFNELQEIKRKKQIMIIDLTLFFAERKNRTTFGFNKFFCLFFLTSCGVDVRKMELNLATYSLYSDSLVVRLPSSVRSPRKATMSGCEKAKAYA